LGDARAGPITFHRIGRGRSCCSGHLGALRARRAPASRRVPEPVSAAGRARFFYFSFLTLTVGYGDVLPVHPVARSLAMLEAVTGPLYLAILVARLVSLAVASDAKSR
jgi:hypothetical protein